MTGDHFDGETGRLHAPGHYAVPRDQLREETVALCNKLKSKNPAALRACKEAYKVIRTMDYTQAKYWLEAKASWLASVDPEDGRNRASASSSTRSATAPAWAGTFETRINRR